MQNRYQIQQNISGKFDVIDTEYNLVQEPSMIEHEAIVHAALLNCEHLRDVRRAAKEQRKGRASLPKRSSLDRSCEGIDCIANKYLA